MSFSRSITTSQTGPHRAIERLVRKHSGTTFAKPITRFTRSAFDYADAFVRHVARSVILDSCCGTGESSHWLAHAFPECCIIGIDKSLHRLSKAKHCHAQNLLQTETDAITVVENATEQMPSNVFYERNNLLFVRADVIDFWRLVAEAAQSGRWEICKHYVLYPNPYPKPHHLMRRWHGHPIFPVMIGLAPQTELCTNWRIYAEEFALASTTLGYTAAIEEHIAHKARTAFERKYAASGHKLYRVEIRTTTVHEDRFVRSNQADGI